MAEVSNVTEQLKDAQITDEVSSEDEIPGLVEGEGDEVAVVGADTVTGGPEDDSLQSRGERKARKTLAKLGLKKVEGINRVTMRRPKGQFVIIANAEVYKSPSSDCYIVFGAATAAEDQTGGLGALAGAGGPQGAASQFAAAEQAEALARAAGRKGKKEVKEEEEEDDGAEVDETGVDAGDIETVMSQVKCSRSKAVKALKEHDGDLINAIMSAS